MRPSVGGQITAQMKGNHEGMRLDHDQENAAGSKNISGTMHKLAESLMEG